MDATNVYLKHKISLINLKECISASGYKTEIHYDSVVEDNILYVYYTPQRAPNFTKNWQISASSSDDIDLQELKVAKSIIEQTEVLFALEFPMIDLMELGEMMVQIFQCYDGYMHFEGKLFDINNVQTIPDYSPT